MQPLNSYRWKKGGRFNFSIKMFIPNISLPSINLDYFRAFFFVCAGISVLGIFFFSMFVAYKIISYEEMKMQAIREYVDYKIYPLAANVQEIKETVDFLSSNAQIIEHRLKVRKYSIKKINGKDTLVYE